MKSFMYKRVMFFLVMLALFQTAVASGAAITWDALTMTVSSAPASWHVNYRADLAVNGTGLDITGLLHKNNFSINTWQTIGGSVTNHVGGVTGKAWIMTDFGTLYNLEKIWVWNLAYPGATTKGLRNVTIEYSVDGSTWNTLSTWTNTLTGLQEIAQSAGTDNYVHETEVTLGITARYVVITANTTGGNWGDATTYGLAEIRFFGVPFIASSPAPSNAMAGVDRNSVLSWAAGASAVSHDVYFGTSSTAVGSATHTSPEFMGNQPGTSYPAVGTLTLDPLTTYYWRVDEIDGSANVYTGKVWSFTAIGSVIPTGNITATSRGNIGATYAIQYTINLSGLSTGLPGEQTHNNGASTYIWLDTPVASTSPSGQTCKTWAKYSFDRVYTMGTMWVWNCNQGGGNEMRGLRNVSVDYSTDGTTWTNLGSYEWPMATGLSSYLPFNVSFNGLQVRHVVISSTQNWGSNYFALSEVQFCPATTAATVPNPSNSAVMVSNVDTALTWVPGISAVTHNVYFGTTFADVDNSVTPVASGLTAPRYPATGSLSLDFSKTYYWRVDEVDASSNVYKGRVWSFTTRANAVPNSSITATASGSIDTSHLIINTVNGSGLTGLAHSTDHQAMWLDPGAGGTGNHPLGLACKAWAMYAFNQSYQLSAMRVWNCNQSGYTTRGLRNVRVDYSTDGITYTTLGSYEWPMASGSSGYLPSTNISFQDLMVKYVVITAAETNGNWGDNYYGLSEVQFTLSGDKATFLNPPNGISGTGVNPAGTNLTWVPGMNAATHNVYFGTNPADVADDAVPVSSGQIGAVYPATGNLSLDFDKDYYWRIDEVNGTTVWKGDIWMFHTATSLLIEDFPTADAVTPWVCNKAGDWVNYETVFFAHSPGSLRLEYDNSESPYLTKATRTFASGQNWAGAGGVALRLFVAGDSSNYSGHSPVFITLTDDDGTPHSATVNSAPNMCQTMTYRPWDIPLSAFAGVNMFNIKSISLGVGDGTASGQPSGDRDTVYFDYILVYPPRCVPELLKAAGDLNSDCKVDVNDLALFAGQWLGEPNGLIPPVQLAAAGAPAPQSTTSPQFAVSGAGLDLSGLLHQNLYASDTWQVSTLATITHHRGGTDGLAWIQADLGRPYELGKMWVWNLGGSGTTGRGMKEVTIEYSADGYVWNTLEGWTNLLTGVKEFAQSAGTNNYTHETEVDFGGVTARYVVITDAVYGGNWDNGIICGLAELRFFTNRAIADLNDDSKVNLKDFALLANDWLSESLFWPQL